MENTETYFKNKYIETYLKNIEIYCILGARSQERGPDAREDPGGRMGPICIWILYLFDRPSFPTLFQGAPFDSPTTCHGSFCDVAEC